MPTPIHDFVVIGAGSAGCAVAEGLVSNGAGSVLVIEAGPSDRWPLVRMPFGLVWMMGGRRDWQYKSAPQDGLGGRSIAIPRGRMVGGSGSINSMVWFPGQASDYDTWNVAGWSWADVAPAFETLEDRIAPAQFEGAHPLTQQLSRLVGGNDTTPPSPERESAGVFRFNMRNGRRWSAADAFLRPAIAKGAQLVQSSPVERIEVSGDRASAVILADGTKVTARKGIVLSAGAIGTPELLLRSGIGPADDLRSAGVDPRVDLPGVGQNLHDHPGVGLHFHGPGSGYGLTPSLAHKWMSAPLQWALTRTGVFASPTVEGGAFFASEGPGAEPDIQTHFIPFFMPLKGSKYQIGQGYFADACLCRPKSRGALRITKSGLDIDLGLFSDDFDLDRLTKGLTRLRHLMAKADFGPMKAPEVKPGPDVPDDNLKDFVRANAGTAYHPVGTMQMGEGDAPVTPRLKVRGLDGLWVADASIMPSVTSANTNAPSMMIGHRAGKIISEDAA